MRPRTWVTVIAGLCLAGWAAPVIAQSATLVGTVLADSTERPLANAEIVLPRLDRSTRSDSAGNFRFTRLKGGVHEIVIRLVGYEAISTTLRVEEGKATEGDFLLRRLPPRLAEIEVKDKGSLHSFRLREFNENRKNGGRYVSAAVFEKASGRQLGTVITGLVPGTRVMRQNGFDGVLATMRGNGMEYGPCPMRVVLNGLIMPPPFSMNDLQTDQVIGLEFYTLATAPMEYRGAGGNCGTVVLWTK